MPWWDKQASRHPDDPLPAEKYHPILANTRQSASAERHVARAKHDCSSVGIRLLPRRTELWVTREVVQMTIIISWAETCSPYSLWLGLCRIWYRPVTWREGHGWFPDWFPAVYMSCINNKFRLFHAANLSVHNFRIFLLMYPKSMIQSKWYGGYFASVWISSYTRSLEFS